jgi:hypothetical protein
MDILTNVSFATIIASWFVVEVTMVVGFLVAVYTLKKVVSVAGVSVRFRDIVYRLVPERVVYRDRDCECHEDEDDDGYGEHEEDEDED